MEKEEPRFVWNKENSDALLYFVENVSGPWHPSQWSIIVELCSQIVGWEGHTLPATSASKAKRSHLHIAPMMQAFIKALTNAEYFSDVNEFYKFMQDSQSDQVFSMFRFWMRIDAPIEKDDEYFEDFVTQIFEYKDNLQELDVVLSSYSDEQIAQEIEMLRQSFNLEEE